MRRLVAKAMVLGIITAASVILAMPPSLVVDIEPTESGSVVFLPLAPRNSGASPNGFLALRLDVTNNESTSVELQKIEVSFPDAAGLGTFSISTAVSIATGTTETVSFKKADYIILPDPAPEQIRISCCAQDSTHLR